MFDGTIVTRKTDPVDFKLKEDVKPILSRPYPVSKLHDEIPKKEVERLVLMEVLEAANDSERGSPSFAKPNSTTNRVHFLSDFRNLNKQLKRKPYPITKSNEML